MAGTGPPSGKDAVWAHAHTCANRSDGGSVETVWTVSMPPDEARGLHPEHAFTRHARTADADIPESSVRPGPYPAYYTNCRRLEAGKA